MSNLEIDFKSAALINDPWPTFHQMMEHEPAHYNAGIRGWCLTRYDDVTAAFKDERMSSDRIRPFISSQRRVPDAVVRPLGDILSLWLVFNDPPMHTRLRRLANKGFTPRAMAAMPALISPIVEELLEAMPSSGEFDFIKHFAGPLPALVIAEILGVPREDMPQLKAWSDDVAGFVLVSRNSTVKYEVASRSLVAMCDYFSGLIAQRRANPGQRVIDDLIAAHDDNDSLSTEELVSTVVLLLFAGHETTTHFIGNGLWSLLRNPEALATARRLGDDAGDWTVALDEMLRWDGPSILQMRILREDVEKHGRVMRAGERVYLFNAAANRDPREFNNPDRFDLERAEARKHLTFGVGAHFCLGAHLARLEGAVAFPRLLDRMADVELVREDGFWHDSLVIRGMSQLPIRRAPR